MAGRPKVRQFLSHEEHRRRIKTSLILNRLQHFALGERNGNDPCQMTADQVKAAVALLKKTIPDLQAIDLKHSGDQDAPILFSTADAKL